MLPGLPLASRRTRERPPETRGIPIVDCARNQDIRRGHRLPIIECMGIISDRHDHVAMRQAGHDLFGAGVGDEVCRERR
jgi:hypothetical protein